MDKIKILLIRFRNNIYHSQIEALRGAVVNTLKDKDVLFHNHLPNGDGYRYSYPLIQYKSINQKVTILCFGEGTGAIGKLFSDTDFEFNLNGDYQTFELDNVKAHNILVQVWNTKFYYNISRWMPLSQSNYEKYMQLEGVAEKTTFLEKVLIGNILSFAKGLGIFFEKQVECKITWLSEPTIDRYKGVKVSLFDADFITNVSIPDFAGLGKGVSIGYGTTVRKKEKQNK